MATSSGRSVVADVPSLLYGGGIGLFLGAASAGWVAFPLANLLAVGLVIGGQVYGRLRARRSAAAGRVADTEPAAAADAAAR